MTPPAAVAVLVVFAAAFGYLVGSVMASDLVARYAKRSARDYWSKNPGTTNSFRVYGKKLGIAVGVMDILKGFFAFVVVWLTLQYALRRDMDADTYAKTYYLAYLTNLFAIIGHCWPVYFRFKGGKAAAPAVGMMLSVSVWWVVISVLVWAAVLLKTRYVSLASIVTACVLPVVSLVSYLDFLHFFYGAYGPSGYMAGVPDYGQSWYVIVFLFLQCLCLTGILTWRHRANIARLRAGTETRTGGKRAAPANSDAAAA